MNRRKANFDFWTKRRVNNALTRFIRDFHIEKGLPLPASQHVYKEMIPPEDRLKSEKERLYAPAVAILRHYKEMVAAWWRFGYLVEVKAKRPKYELTPEIEEMLHKIYDYRFRGGERPAEIPSGPKGYARQLGLPGDVCTKWAGQLGLAKTKELPWTDEEIALLDKYGFRSPYNLVLIFKEHGYKRTEIAIMLMRKRRMSHKASPYYSVNAISKLFGTDAHVVKSWVDKGWLKHIMKGTTRSRETSQNGDTHLVHKDWIYEFICKYPNAFQLKKVDQLWFLHIVTRGDVRLMFSDREELGKKTEGQMIEAPIEWRKSKLKKLKAKAAAGTTGTASEL